jgi:hypothetical protein
LGAGPTVVRYLPARPLRPLGRLRWKASDPALLLPDGLLEEEDDEAAESVYLKDTDPALTRVPVEPLGPSAAKAARHGKWHAAIAASLVLHFAVVWFFVDANREDVLLDGSENAGLTMDGSATAQFVADELDVTRVTLIDMVEAKRVEAPTAEAVPVNETAKTAPVEIAEPVEEMVAEELASDMAIAETPTVATPIEASTMAPETASASPPEKAVEAPPVAQAAVAEAPTIALPIEASTVLSEMAQTTPPEQMFEAVPETVMADVLAATLPMEALSFLEVALVEQPVEAIAVSRTPIDGPASEPVSVLPPEKPEILAVDDIAPQDDGTEVLQPAKAEQATHVTKADTLQAEEPLAAETVEIVREASETLKETSLGAVTTSAEAATAGQEQNQAAAMPPAGVQDHAAIDALRSHLPDLPTDTPIFFDIPIQFGDPAIDGKSISMLIRGKPMFSPIKGLEQTIWDNHCSACHQWTKERLCDQAKMYATNESMITRLPHPLGTRFKVALAQWAQHGCQ